MTVEMLKGRVLEVVKEISWIDENGGIEIYTDYRERELPISVIKSIMEAPSPQERFEEVLLEWADDYATNYGEDELERTIKKSLTQEGIRLFDENVEEVWEVIRENTYFYYNKEDFNNSLCVNVMVDCGNARYDYTCDNVLNWYGRLDGGIIPAESSILWLAKTQKKATILRKACKCVWNGGRYEGSNKFVRSCVQEFLNLPSSMGTVVFLVKLCLFELLNLMELQKSEKCDSYVVLGKDTVCGLYDPWSGGGSVLEIELDRSVKLPIEYCVFCVDGCKMCGYDVSEVYEFVGDAWKETIKEVRIIA